MHVLEQGDILERYQLFAPVDKIDPALKFNYGDDQPLMRSVHNLIIMSQSCDLVQLKTDVVIASEIFEQSEMQKLIRVIRWRKTLSSNA